MERKSSLAKSWPLVVLRALIASDRLCDPGTNIPKTLFAVSELYALVPSGPALPDLTASVIRVKAGPPVKKRGCVNNQFVASAPNTPLSVSYVILL
jgi:hypothetical protein